MTITLLSIAMLRTIVVVVGSTHLQSMLLAMFTMKKGMRGFLCMHLFPFLWLWCSAWWLFRLPELHF